jgi:hypothetical protein
MGGYWDVFYEDDNSWSSSLGNVCSTIVNYGVELPWCVCATSTTLITTVTEFLTMLALTVYTFLGMETWWCCEYTVAAVFTLMNLPFAVMRSKGSKLHFLSMLIATYTGLAHMGTMYELFAGLQGGVVFGGKLFYPTLAMFALATQSVRLYFVWLNHEVYGFLAAKEGDKMPKFDKAVTFLKEMLKDDALMLLAIATFGLPKLEADIDPATWLFMLPLLAAYKDILNYCGVFDKPTECKESNGEVMVEKKVEAPAPVVAAAEKKEEKKAEPAAKKEEPKKKEEAKKEEPKKKEEAKKEEPKKKEEAKKEEPKKDKKKEADTDKKEEEKPTEAVVTKESVVCRVMGLACHSVCSSLNIIRRGLCLVNGCYAKVAALPWDKITHVFFTLGINFTIALTLWTLTEDPIAIGAPLFSLVLPKVVKKYEGKLGADNAALLLNLNTMAFFSTQYYLFKTNITHATY